MIRTFQSLLMVFTALLMLGGCVSSGGNPNFGDYATKCMFEVNPAGAIVWSGGDTEVTSKGGNPGDAEAMNACIRAKAAAAGDDLSVGAPPGANELEVAGGGTVTETFTYGQPPAAPKTTGPVEEKICPARNVLTGGSGYYQCSK